MASAVPYQFRLCPDQPHVLEQARLASVGRIILAGQFPTHPYDIRVIVVHCGWCPRTRRDVAGLQSSEFTSDSCQ